MDINKYIDEIILHSHFWNWAPDWQVVKEVYEAFPNSYSVLSPFAYSYLEELIRSITSEYGIEILNKDGTPQRRKVGTKLIELAIEENKHKSQELLTLLEELKLYFLTSKITDNGNNRNSVVHGYMHPKFWSDESFEKLIYDIARLSKFAGF
ncbi:hypothetical protein [Spirosoma radiotolerans]|uniref:DUF4209 domain-containing protein n=1 Tax=Spirosoma radiotolerans TaxID=1379870 RepID=A0A0E3V627_9BACT|nr:hypothetical protein [Spirosoma radiotolerans]AKD54166.1 hypothetical protein SD10_03825 [Spirosoma radiotolerans]